MRRGGGRVSARLAAFVVSAAGLLCAAALASPARSGAPAEGAHAPAGDGGARRYDSVSVARFGARPGDGRDDSRAFQLAADSARRVHVPAGVYHFDQSVVLPSDTRVRGVGAASELVVRGPIKYVFFSHQTRNVAVERMAFRDPSPDTVYAFWPRFVTGARFEGNRVQGMSMLTADNSTEVDVVGNHARGAPGTTLHGVDITFSRRVRVRRNEVRDFRMGIQWWGHIPGNPARLASDIAIDSNTVANVESGIWGAYGERVTVTGNDVEVCADLCLDAEASHDVRFIGNHARFGGAGVLGVYFDASDVVFERNVVVQDGRPHGDRGAAITDPALVWSRMLWIPGDAPPAAVLSTRLRGNRFTYTGPRDRVGTLQKQRTNRVEIEGNVFVNTVIDMVESDHGSLVVADNEFILDYAAGKPAIGVGNNHDIGNRPRELVVRGNRIQARGARFPASTPAIRVRQSSRRGAVRSVVERNTIRGFSTAISYGGQGSPHRFEIVENRHEGAIAPAGGGRVQAELRGNRAP